MAFISNHSLPTSLASPVRSLIMGAFALLAVATGLQVVTTEETSFYRTHGMVPDERTAIRLGQMVLAGHHGKVCGSERAAQLQGDVWLVETRQPDNPNGAGSCRVLLDRKDGQVLRVETTH
jgi:hypothetical protein